MSSRRRLVIGTACLWVACAGSVQAAPQSGSLLRQTLDERTTLTLTGLDAPLVLYREEPQLALNAREYVQVAPLEVNRQGELRYYLWMGVWSTILPESPEGIRGRFERVYLFADGEPMDLAVTAWGLAEKGTDIRFYRKPVDSAVDAFYTVTADQLRRIGAAKEVYLVSDLDPQGRYEAWEWNPNALTAFADYTQDRRIR